MTAVDPPGSPTITTMSTGTPTPLSATPGTPFSRRVGFDLAWFQAQLQTQQTTIEDQLRAVQANENLSDTERMFEMQMLMNTWSTITNLRTNMMKSISDSLKTIVRNVA